MTITSLLQEVPIEAIANGLHFRLSKNEQWVALKVEDGASNSVRVHSLVSSQQTYHVVLPNPIMDIQFSPDTEELIIIQKGTVTYWDFQKDNTTAYDLSPFVDDTFLDLVYDPNRKQVYLLKKGQILVLSLEEESITFSDQTDTRTAHNERFFQSKGWIGFLPGADSSQPYSPVLSNALWSKEDIYYGESLPEEYNEALSVSLAEEEQHVAWAINTDESNTQLTIYQYCNFENTIQLEGINAINSRLQFLNYDRILMYYAMHNFYFFDVESGELLEKISYNSKAEPEGDWVVDFAVSADESCLMLLIATNHKNDYSYELVLKKVSMAHVHPAKTTT